MKKLFLLSALALGAMMMSAQIELIGTITKPSNYKTIVNKGFVGKYASSGVCTTIPTRYFAAADKSSYGKTSLDIKVYNMEDCKLVKTISIPKLETDDFNVENIGNVYDNFWTTDGKLAFLFNNNVYNEDGEIVITFKGTVDVVEAESCFYILDQVTEFRPMAGYVETGDIDIYKISKPKQTTNVPTASARTSNVRKVVENGQMYIILDGVKYAVTGTEL